MIACSFHLVNFARGHLNWKVIQMLLKLTFLIWREPLEILRLDYAFMWSNVVVNNKNKPTTHTSSNMYRLVAVVQDLHWK